MAEGTGFVWIPGSQQDSDANLPIKQRYSGSAAHVTEAILEFAEIYDDGTYQYFGEAFPSNPRPAMSAAVWRVSRIHKTNSREEWVDSGNFTQVFTNVGVVAGLF